MPDTYALIPYIPQERMTGAEASKMLGVSTSTIFRYARDHHLGRLIGGKLALSRVAVQLWAEDNQDLLARYLAGDRSSDQMRDIYRRLGIALPPAVAPVAAE